MFFSIIIPVYKVEAYLRQCVDSVLAQSFTDFEVILVDDGSPDGCPAICDSYAAADPRIDVIHKPNGGLSDARNAGLHQAKGEYVLFIDSDDYWLDNGALTQLYECHLKYPQSDIIFFGGTVVINDSQFPSASLPIADINGKAKILALKKMLFTNTLRASACLRLIRRELLITNKLFFKKGMLSEDILWSIGVNIYAKSIAAIDNNFYAYRKRENSITTSISDKNLLDLVYIIKFWKDKLTNLSISQSEKEIYLGFLAYELCILMSFISVSSSKTRSDLIQFTKDNIDLLRFDINPKVKKVRLLSKIFGVKLSSKILWFYRTHRSKSLKKTDK